jgi:hypothetical protein
MRNVVNQNRVFAGTTAALLLIAAPLAAQEITELPGQDRMLNANFEEVFRVGSFDGAEWETFGEVDGLAFDAEGNLFIYDGQSSRVVVTDNEGNFLREVGQAGEGPGEFRMPMGITVLRDGTLVVADMGHRAYSVFRPDGVFDRMISMGGGGGMIRIGELQADPTGMSVISGGGGMQIRMGPGAGEEPTSRPIERIVLSGEEALATTVAEAWLPPRSDRPMELSGGGTSFSMGAGRPREFEPGLYSGVLPDGGVVYSDSTGYALKVVDASGALQRVLHRPFNARPVTEAIEEAERERQMQALIEGGGGTMRVITAGPGGGRQEVPPEVIREMMQGRIEQMEFYPELPVLQGLTTGWNGTIWVERRGDEPVGVGPIDLVKPDGQYVGTFATGETEVPMAFGPDGLIAFMELDEFDVPTVVVKRLPEPVR